MIKGGGTINNQISEAYAGAGAKMGGIKNGSFYQSKYISSNSNANNGGTMNQSPSPSQTFFKENPPMMMMMDTSKKAPAANNNSSFAGKKVLPNTYKNPKKLYVSPYS